MPCFGMTLHNNLISTQNFQQQMHRMIGGHHKFAPTMQILPALCRINLLPKIITRQLNRRCSARHQHPLFYRHQPFIFTNMLPKFLLHFLQILRRLVQPLQHRRIILIFLTLPLAFQLLQNIQLQFRTRRAFHNLKQRAQRNMVRPFIIARGGMVEAVEQMLNANQAANALSQWVVKIQHLSDFPCVSLAKHRFRQPETTLNTRDVAVQPLAANLSGCLYWQSHHLQHAHALHRSLG